jgi:uncharacterized protein YndB with AHSA1/START domain
MMEPLKLEFTVSCSPKHAFDVWAFQATKWWPRDHPRSGNRDLTVTFEPRIGGRIFERDPDGVEHEWGEVLVWEPPHRLSYLWHIYGDRAEATEGDVRFAAAGGVTMVPIVHTGWERLGGRGEELRKRNRHGWDVLTSHFRRACLVEDL